VQQHNTTKGKVIMKKVIFLFSLTVLLLQAVNVLAMTTPAAGSFAYDLYDIAVTQILLGPIGFVAGVASMAFAAILAIRQMILPAAGVVLGGAFLLSADTVVQSIGAVIM
jgi:hypothetical protein